MKNKDKASISLSSIYLPTHGGQGNMSPLLLSPPLSPPARCFV